MGERQGRRLLVEQTNQFVNENPSDIVVTRHTKVDDGAGGHTTTSALLEPQRARLVPTAPSAAVERRTADGEVLTTLYSVVADPSIDMREGDTFLINGIKHEVVIAVGIGGYEFRAEVVRRG